MRRQPADGACDISRRGVGDVGGLTPLMKTVRLCESFGMRCEIHGVNINWDYSGKSWIV